MTYQDREEVKDMISSAIKISSGENGCSETGWGGCILALLILGLVYWGTWAIAKDREHQISRITQLETNVIELEKRVASQSVRQENKP